MGTQSHGYMGTQVHGAGYMYVARERGSGMSGGACAWSRAGGQ